MTGAKTPPERVTVYWIMGMAYCMATPYDTADEPHVYVRADIVEKRERALREVALAADELLEKGPNVVEGDRLWPQHLRLMNALDALDALAAADERGGEAVEVAALPTTSGGDKAECT